MGKKVPITVAHGDGIGPEIMEATIAVMEAAGAELDIHEVEIGEKVYLRGHAAGIEPETWDTIRNTKAFLKAPITTPQGGGFKSLNVTIRGALGLYANVRPCISYHPQIDTKHPIMDVVVVRENEEDLYTGVEYRQSADTFCALKMISSSASERICRYAFEYAAANDRKKVTCFTKDNILKMSDGAFHAAFEEVAKDYPDIENEHWIIDIGAAKLADSPENFDVLVLPNLYGDILSDVAAQIAGSVGLAGSANIGEHAAMFEAIHGSAPRRAGQNLANPSGLMAGAVLMLVHIGQTEAANKMQNAWLKTIEDGIHTYDIYEEGVSTEKVGTREFGEAIIARMGQKPTQLKSAHFGKPPKAIPPLHSAEERQAIHDSKELVGIDVFVDSTTPVETLQESLTTAANGTLKLTMIANRGVKVWPDAHPETACVDQWRCRFMSADKGHSISAQQTLQLLGKFADAGIDCIKTENLYTFAGQPGYTLAQDEQ